MPRVINYPRYRRRSFAILGLSVVAFATSFWWAKLLFDLMGEIAMLVWLANLLLIGFGLIEYVKYFRRQSARDYRRVKENFMFVTDVELEIIKNNNLECTIHQLEHLEEVSMKRVYIPFVEFLSDDDNVWFLMARPTSDVAYCRLDNNFYDSQLRCWDQYPMSGPRWIR